MLNGQSFDNKRRKEPSGLTVETFCLRNSNIRHNRRQIYLTKRTHSLDKALHTDGSSFYSDVRNSPSFQRSIDHGPHVVELHASRGAESDTYVTFIYEKGSDRLLRHIVGTDQNEVIDQALAWSESNPQPISPQALDRLQRASADERSAEFELFQKLLNGSAIDEIASGIEKFCEARRSANELWQRYLFGIALLK